MVVWLSYILTEQDHRLEPVQRWVNSRARLFNRLLGIELRETDFTDDRLANVLTTLGVTESQEMIAQRLSQDWITMYELPTEVIRYDSTTIAVYQESDEGKERIIGYGHSKDYHPDLTQFKVMLSSLDMGMPLTSQVVNGKRADDGLYLLAYEQVVKTVGHSRFLAIGDSKMAAWETRCQLTMGGSWYLCPYREPASRGEDIEPWIEKALTQPEQWQAVTQTDEKTGEVKTVTHVYTWSRPQQSIDSNGNLVTWDERILVAQFLALQQGLTTRRERQEAKLYQALDQLRLPPSRGRKRYRTELELRQVVEKTLKQFEMTGLATVSLTAEAHKDGRQRWIVADYQRHQAAW